MKPTQVLEQEHRVIEKVLACLEKIEQEALRDKKLNAEAARQAIEFFKNFADKCHHGKEEVHLFPLMEEKGFPRDSGPTGVMMYEHEQGRQFIAGMSDSIEKAEQGDADALRQFSEHARGYIAMLQEHINKEDHCLFPMADQTFSEEEQQTLSQHFDRVEHEEMGEGAHEKYHGIAETLCKQYDVEFTGGSVEGHHTGCQH
jgi:hemerythrin-like domain-containing protein